MNKYKAVIQYKGTAYCGFCKQTKESTIESELESAIKSILGSKPNISVAGRTDAGVHALGQVVSWRSSSTMTLTRIKYGLNSVLPGDIKISSLEVKGDDFDARFSAQARQYVYYLLNRRFLSVVHDEFCYHYPRPLDIELMKKPLKYLKGVHDFKAFSAQKGNSKTFTRDIKGFKIEKKSDFFDVDDKDMIKITIKANSFLYRMVRNLVGTLIEVGLGNIEPKEVQEILDSMDRREAGPTASAKGLFLEKVFY